MDAYYTNREGGRAEIVDWVNDSRAGIGIASDQGEAAAHRAAA